MIVYSLLSIYTSSQIYVKPSLHNSVLTFIIQSSFKLTLSSKQDFKIQFCEFFNFPQYLIIRSFLKIYNGNLPNS